MDTEKSRKPTTKQYPLNIKLISTRLIKLSVESLEYAEKASSGKLELVYDIATPEHNSEHEITILNIKGRGIDKGDEDKTTFTFDSSMMGMFSVDRKPNKVEAKKSATEMANLIIPLLTDTIETALSKCGYGSIKLAKSISGVQPVS